MSKIKKLLKKHAREIAKLRANCPHKEISGWIDCLDGRTIIGKVKVCNECGEFLKRNLY